MGTGGRGGGKGSEIQEARKKKKKNTREGGQISEAMAREGTARCGNN